MIGIDVVIGIGLPQPLVLLVVDAGLQPGIALQMPDTPGVAHGVAGSYHLRVEAVVDDGAAVLLGLVNIAVGKTGAEAVRIVETVEIDLRLG